MCGQPYKPLWTMQIWTGWGWGCREDQNLPQKWHKFRSGALQRPLLTTNPPVLPKQHFCFFLYRKNCLQDPCEYPVKIKMFSLSNIPKIMFNLFSEAKKGSGTSFSSNRVNNKIYVKLMICMLNLVPASWSRKDRRWGRRGKQTQNSFRSDLCRFLWKCHSAYKYV